MKSRDTLLTDGWHEKWIKDELHGHEIPARQNVECKLIEGYNKEMTNENNSPE